VSPSAQRELSAYARLLHERGWVANHDGNASVRLPDKKRYVATPTATSKRAVDAHGTIIVDLTGKVLSGRSKLFGEWHLHAACYAARADVCAVLHAHPPYATALGVSNKALGVPALPEMVVSLGANVPLLSRALPKTPAQDAAIHKALTDGDADAFMLSGNGVVTVGVDLEQAYLRMELVEHYARIVVLAAPLGGVTPLDGDDLKKLLDARTKAGLGKAGRAR
jgi:L-fuculose-phosphate aldolase